MVYTFIQPIYDDFGGYFMILFTTLGPKRLPLFSRAQILPRTSEVIATTWSLSLSLAPGLLFYGDLIGTEWRDHWDVS